MLRGVRVLPLRTAELASLLHTQASAVATREGSVSVEGAQARHMMQSSRTAVFPVTSPADGVAFQTGQVVQFAAAGAHHDASLPALQWPSLILHAACVTAGAHAHDVIQLVLRVRFNDRACLTYERERESREARCVHAPHTWAQSIAHS